MNLYEAKQSITKGENSIALQITDEVPTSNSIAI